MSENAQEIMKKDWQTQARDGGTYTNDGSAAHYAEDLLEYIDDIERQFGTAAAYFACIVHETKYRKRAGNKAGVPAEKDMVKAQWYRTCGKHFKLKLAGAVVAERPYIPVLPKLKVLFTGDADSTPEPLGEIVKRMLADDKHT